MSLEEKLELPEQEKGKLESFLKYMRESEPGELQHAVCRDVYLGFLKTYEKQYDVQAHIDEQLYELSHLREDNRVTPLMIDYHNMTHSMRLKPDEAMLLLFAEYYVPEKQER